jgi:GR25 family glycosyltransferase involved in LPS biosynthesis
VTTLGNGAAAVISLRSTPQRMRAFQTANAQALQSVPLLQVDGVEGRDCWPWLRKARLVKGAASQCWTAGAIGAGLSHRLCWRLCCERNTPLLVMEDDVILASHWKATLDTLLKTYTGRDALVLLGWNTDSVLRAEWRPGLDLISLFEPAYMGESSIRDVLESQPHEQHHLRRLKHCFGLPAYWITPGMAAKLLQRIQRFDVQPMVIGRGIPVRASTTLDGQLNQHYADLAAQVVMPPLALALNSQNQSLTRRWQPLNFGS